MAEDYDIFISYRRDGGFATANHIYKLLTRDGYSVCFDVDSLREGDFNINVLNSIDQCTDFLLIVDRHCFDKTLDSNFDSRYDWLRMELAYALKQNKNIVPILLDGINNFPQNLPEDICAVTTKNGPEYNQSYFDEFYNKLRLFLHSNPKNSRFSHKNKILVSVIIIVALLAYLFKVPDGFGSRVIEVKDSLCINPVLGQYNYTGPIDQDGLPHGKGKAIFPIGDTYEGDFSHGKFEGKCIYNHVEVGDKFYGTYKDNVRYEGTYVWKDGPYFTGLYKNNELYEGILYDVRGKILKKFKRSIN